MENQESTESTQNEQLKTAHDLAATYGDEMRRHGMSLEWSSPRSCPDTTSKLRANPDFQSLPKDIQNEILNFGRMMKIFGMGCYQENTYAARYYDECHGKPPQNPFSNIAPKVKQENPGQFGE